jgi:hypothetical protein
MKKIILVAAFLGILLGATIFFSAPSAAEPPRVMLQNSVVPQAKAEVGAVTGNQSDWSAAIGFLLGGLVAFSTFLIAKRRA